MGDKGKKDKEKGRKQKVIKEGQKTKDKLEKQHPRAPQEGVVRFPSRSYTAISSCRSFEAVSRH